MPTKVLIKFSHGLGDVTQASVILKHLRKYRPDWIVDVRCGRGKHTALVGQCNKVWHDQEPDPQGPYDTILDLGWWENFNRYADRPNSKVTNCLQEVFGIPYDKSLGRYAVQISHQAKQKAFKYLASIPGAECNEQGAFNIVIVHYEGNTSPSKKNLAHWQAQAFCKSIISMKRIPLIFDWDGRSPIPDNKTIFNPGVGEHDIWGGFGSGDAEMIAAIISQCEAYIGVDSGPGKIASATNTPSLICWKRHHPIQFHDPAPNTMHLVPIDHHTLPPCCDQDGIAQYFEKHYRFAGYVGDHGLVNKVADWLAALFNIHFEKEPSMTFVLPNGIGDVMWALLKIEHISQKDKIDLILSGDPRREIDHRATFFLKRFPFVRDISVNDVPILHDRDHPTNSRGRYNYVSDGVREDFHYLIPNATLETGRRIEDWLPQHKINWDVIKGFNWEGAEKGTLLGQGMSPFVAFYLGPEKGHTDEGHNLGWLWEPKHWIELGVALKERGINVVVVGASYDRSFYERYVKQGVYEAKLGWVDLIGKLEIGETFALLKESKCLISYQCGLGIVGHYMGVKVAMWWRPDGNSCHPERLVCFDEHMATAWVRPGWEDRYMGLIYLRETPQQIIAEIDKRGWLQ